MKMHRPVLARAVLSLLVAMLGGLLGGSSAVADSSVAIAISGTVDGTPESVYVSGLAQITSSTRPVPDGAAPFLSDRMDARGNPEGNDSFTNVPLITQEGPTHNQYDDQLKEKKMAINLIYPSCKDESPIERQLH